MSPKSKAFISPEGFTLDGFRFRDISLGDADIAPLLGITMLGGAEEECAERPAAISTQIGRLLWQLHIGEGEDKDSAVDRVLAALDDGSWKEKCRAFGFKLSASALVAMTDRLNGESKDIEAASVKVEEAESAGDPKKKALNPASSQASSGLSPEAA